MVYEVSVVCSTCSADDTSRATYLWVLYEYNNTGFKRTADLDSSLESFRSDKIFDLKENVLQGGKTYKIEITVTVRNKSPTQTVTTFSVNQEPYGGECSVSPSTGVSSFEEFTFECKNWKDEGSRDHRDSSMDGNEPLIYTIKQIKGNETQVIYSGSESSTVQYLEVCPKEDNHTCVIEFRIEDGFKSEAVVYEHVVVTSPLPEVELEPEGLSETKDSNTTDAHQAAITAFLEKSLTVLVLLKNSNDYEKTVKVSSVLISAINTIQLKQITKDTVIEIVPDDDNVNEAVAKTLTELTKTDPRVTELQVAMENITKTLLNSIQLLTLNSGKDFNGANVTTKPPNNNVLISMATALATSMKQSSFVKPGIVTTASKGVATLSEMFLKVLKNNRDVNELDNATKALGSALGDVNKEVTDVVLVDKVEDLEGSEVFFQENMTEKEQRLNVIERKYMKKVADKKRLVRKEQILRDINETVANFEKATDNILEMWSEALPSNTNKTLELENLSLAVEKTTIENIVEADRQSMHGLTFSLSGVDHTSVINRSANVEVRLKVMKDNIYIKSDYASIINGPVIEASVRGSDGKTFRISGPVITQTDAENAPLTLTHPTFTEGDAAKMFYHSFYYRTMVADICVLARPVDNVKVVYDVFFRALIPPTDMRFDHFVFHDVDPGVSGTTLCVRAGAVKRTGVAYIALRPRLNEVVTVSRKKRSASDDNSTTTTSADLLVTPYLFRVTTIVCFSLEGEALDWRTHQCKLVRNEDKNETTCICPNSDKLVASVSFFVPPNKIDFSTVFSKFDIKGQAAVLSTIIVIYVIFVVLALFSRYKDGQDVLQWGVSLLEDNFSDDCYFYLITVYTGMIRHGGTRSKIEFNISGEEGETGIRVLTDGVRKEFTAGSVLHFIMAVPLPLGHLQCLRIWHDNSGKGKWASWYLNRIEVVDLQTSERFDFLCYKWLSFEEGQIEQVLGVGSSENMKNFKTMFFEHARHHVTDDHLWLSTVLRPVKSHFSRVQRVGCCLALLLLSMISNAMFFKSRDFKDRQQQADFELGPFKFNVSQIWVSFISAIITAIPVFMMMFLFKKSKLSKSQTSTEEYTSHWMSPCFKRFKFYKDSVALQKVLVIKDIVDDEEGVLPHFCVYIAWIIVILASAASSFFVILYSAEWGKDISEEFLMTFFMSFAESMFVLDPFKILFLAIIFAAIMKKIKVVRPTMFDLRRIYEKNTKIGKQTIPRRRVDYRSAFPEKVVEEVRFKVKQNEKMQKAVSEFLVTVFLLVLLCSICYSNRDPHGFLLRTNLQNQLFRPIDAKHSTLQADLPVEDDIHCIRDYYMWLNYTIIDAMYPEENFNKDLLGPEDRLLMSDLTNYRVGAPRLRLLRQRKVVCSLPYIGNIPCIPPYSIITEDTETYCLGWNTTKPCDPEEGLRLTSDAWSFVPASKIWGIPIPGGLTVYGGGGYIAEMDISRAVAKQTIRELIDTMWINRQTRAVFLEFTVYSGNLNMFAYISLLSEFPETGAVLHFTNIFTFRSLEVTGGMGIYIRICEILFLITTFVWVIVICVRLLKERWSFFRQFWNIAELATVSLSFTAVVLYFIRLRYTTEALAKFRENTRIFVNFFHIAVWDSFFIYVVSVLLAIVTLRLIKVMGYTKVTRTVFTVLKKSSKTLPGFFFYVILVLFAFAMCGLIFFGPFSKEYKDIITCLESLFSGVLGHAGFTKMTIPAESSWFGLIYFITFIVVVTFTLANIFMTILLDTMAMLAEERGCDRDFELTTYLWNSAKEIVTGKKKDGTLQSKQDIDHRTIISTFRQIADSEVRKRHDLK